MKRKLQIIFIVFALFGFALPVLKFNKTGRVSIKEKRNLADRPYIFKDGRLNESLFSEYDSYFNDRIGGRLKLIKLDNSIKKTMNKGKVLFNDRGIQGKNGWFFYIYCNDGNNLEDFYKRNLLNSNELEQFKTRIIKTVQWCKENEIKFVFLIGPNKHSVYAEYYPFERPEGITRTDQIVNIYKELEVPYIFPRDLLISKKQDFNVPLYYETDTHWNALGAYLAFTLLREKVIFAFPDVEFPKINYETKIEYSETAGDILLMLGIEKSRSTQPKLIPVLGENNGLYSYLVNEEIDGVKTIVTSCENKTLPRALIFRDSFFSALEPFTSPLFSETEYLWKRFDEKDKEHVLQYKPDIIIFESVERYLLWI